MGFFTFSDSSWTDSYAYPGSRQIAWRAQANEFFTHFIHANVTGSTTQVTDQAGNLGTGIAGNSEDLVWYPFGVEYTNSGSWNDTVFGGMEPYQRNFGLNPTPNRLQPPLLGRWTTPDPMGKAAADPSNPQSWNRYSYVTNNPATLTDPLGLLGSTTVGCDPGAVCTTPIQVTSWAPAELDPMLELALYGLWRVPSTMWHPQLPKPNSGPSWWGTFAKGFVRNFSFKSARLPGESFSACVDRVQTALFGRTGANVFGAISGLSLATGAATGSFGSRTIGRTIDISTKELTDQTISNPSVMDLIAEGGVDAGTLSAGTAETISVASAALSKVAVPVAVGTSGIGGGILAACR